MFPYDVFFNSVSDVEIVEPKVQRLTILAGDEINMKCVGDAKTRLVWYHRTKQLQSSPRPMVIVTEARDFHSNKWTSMITVRTRDSRQAGVYQCRSRNDPLNHDNVTVIIQTPARRKFNIKGTQTVYFSSSLYIINEKPMIPRTHFHCITTWGARSSG